MLLRLRLLLVSFCLTLFACAGASAATSVVIVSSERSAAYMEAAQALIGELERQGVSRHDVTHLDSSEWNVQRALSARLYVALGAEAADRLARSALAAPVLCTLLPRSSFERVLQRSGRKVSAQFSALYLDQPMSRQMELIRLALPAARRLGVLWGAEPAPEAATLKALAQTHGLRVTEAAIKDEQSIFPALKSVLEDADLLLAVPNPGVYNSSSIQNILLTSFRAKVPMLAFSPAYVRAGALLALHAAPAQIGLQAATLALAALGGKGLPEPPVYSKDFQISVNEYVARSLGLTLDAESLRLSLRRSEGAP